MFKYRLRLVIYAVLSILGETALATGTCRDVSLGIQILGSGGPEMTDQRASTGYLIWRDGHARVLIDMGPGSMLRFEQTGAQVNDLQVILLTHLHVDHSADLPALIKAGYFTRRNVDLPVYGPTGNTLMPGTTAFVADLFNSASGVFRYLGSYLNGEDTYRLLPHDISAEGKQSTIAVNDRRFKITAVSVHHGPIPALAWRIDLAGQAIVISGDMNGDNHTLELLATGADILIAHHAIPEDAHGTARDLHMPPSVIGTIAATAKVKQLVLSHRMMRTLGNETESEKIIRHHYGGRIVFGDDLQCFSLQATTEK